MSRAERRTRLRTSTRSVVMSWSQCAPVAFRYAPKRRSVDSRAYTVTELARHTGVATSTASEHLAKLLDGAAFLSHMLTERWCTRTHQSRALRIITR